MEKITELLDNLDKIGELVPELDTLLGWTQLLTSFAVRIGPLCILVLGLIYLLIPPKEANRKAGFRTYFGMGSVMAWRFTQFASGILMTLVGAILTIIAFSTTKKFSGMDVMEISQSAFACIKGQIICALAIWIFMMVFTAVLFDRKGNPRFNMPFLEKFREKPRKPRFKKVQPPEEAPVPEQIPETVPAQPEDPSQVYEVQGEQVITADDIVIEGLD